MSLQLDQELLTDFGGSFEGRGGNRHKTKPFMGSIFCALLANLWQHRSFLLVKL